ncbi:MAG: hypothetical protein ACJ77K_07750 [Bacteroidia bacterium]
MKTLKLIFAALLVQGSVFAQFSSYSFNRKLNKIEKEDYYAIPVSPEIIARCNGDLSDIRIYNVGADTTEVPYLVDKMGTRITEPEVPFQLINDTYNQKCCSYVTLKFPKLQLINRIKLDVTEHNFDKSLKIEGSNDGKEWFTIRERMRIVRFQNATEDFSYTTLDFQDTEFQYFRIKFDDDSSPKVTVSGAYAFENVSTKGQYTLLKTAQYKQTDVKKEKRSEVIVDFPYNYSLSYMTVWCDNNKDYYRNINIYKSNGIFHTQKGDIENWQLINSDVLSTSLDNTYNLYNYQTKRLKIEIINYDDQPVTVKDIKVYGENLRLLSQLPAKGDNYIVYGKENGSAPTYDLVHFREKIPASLSRVEYGDEQIKVTPAIAKAGPLIESKNWLWMVMGAVILIIGYFALSMIRKEGND